MPTAGQKKLLVELKNNLIQALPEGQVNESDYARTGGHLEVHLNEVGMRRVARAMLEKRFYLETVTAVDYIDYFELVYFYSTYFQDILRVKTRIRINKDSSPFSISAVYPGAIWLEREVYDFSASASKSIRILKGSLIPMKWNIFHYLRISEKRNSPPR